MNDTWDIIDMKEAECQKILNSKWIFKKKENGVFKDRLV